MNDALKFLYSQVRMWGAKFKTSKLNAHREMEKSFLDVINEFEKLYYENMELKARLGIQQSTNVALPIDNGKVGK